MRKRDLTNQGWQKRQLNLLGRTFSRRVITPEEYFETVPYVMYNMEQPLGDASAIVFAIGCKATAEHTKICYSGEGADESGGERSGAAGAAATAPLAGALRKVVCAGAACAVV